MRKSSCEKVRASVLNHNLEPATASVRRLEIHESMASELIAESYKIYRQAAMESGYKESSAFLREVFERGLVPLIENIGRGMNKQCWFMAGAPNKRAMLETLLDQARTSVQKLQSKWTDRVDGEAEELEQLEKTTSRFDRDAAEYAASERLVTTTSGDWRKLHNEFTKLKDEEEAAYRERPTTFGCMPGTVPAKQSRRPPPVSRSRRQHGDRVP